MKKIFKPILVALLVIVFTVLMIVPANAGWVHIIGIYGHGPGGVPTCYCPYWNFHNCGCAFPE